jgi:ABC-type transport system involved in cytochrome bd biosynthesis fused ATPase/permease subunit
VRSLLFNPELWLAEGDFMFLNRRERQKVFDFILDYLRDKTVVISTNDLTLAKKCDRIILMKSGTIYTQGSAKALKEDAYFREIFH